jgi:hypothetical protein
MTTPYSFVGKLEIRGRSLGVATRSVLRAVSSVVVRRQDIAE